MWILLLGAFITRGSYYMVWPFLAVILYREFGISATMVGSILTVAALISVVGGFVGSTLSDRFGRKPVMYVTGTLYVIAFCALANASSLWMFAIVITLCSISTEVWRPCASALVGDIIEDKTTRELAMQSLYFAVNVGCAIGPMLGFWLGIAGQLESFYVTAAMFVIFLLLLAWGFSHQTQHTARKSRSSPKTSEKQQTSFAQTIQVLLQDRLLQVLILANILCLFIYGQMDSTLIQYLTRSEVPNLEGMISSLILTNALVIITSQFVLLKLMARMRLTARIQLGLVLLLLSQWLMSAIEVTAFWWWVKAVILMSLAETILFPTMNVHLDRIAPDHLRGAYFGASAFYSLGFALAPLGGGWLLDHYGGATVYQIMAFMCLLVMLLYWLLPRLSRPSLVVASPSEK